MADSLADRATPRHLPSRAVMAKADLQKIETPWREQVGQAIARTFALAGVSQKEAAALLDRDPSQIAWWCAGSERAQMDALLTVEAFRQPLIVAFAELAGAGVDVHTTITVRRTA